MLTQLTADQALTWDRGYFPIAAAICVAVALVGLASTIGRKNRSGFFGLLCLSLVFLSGLAYHLPYTNDDSFIFLRYARNIAQGQGPVWNPGELCEGFTSPAWLALLSAAHVAGLEPLLMGKVLGAAFGLGTLLLTWLTCRRLKPDPPMLFASLLMLAASSMLQSWICSGMDVAIFLFWEALVVWLFTRDRPPLVASFGVTAIAGWIRPEANLVIMIAWGWRFWRDRGRCSRGALLARGVCVVALLALPFLARAFAYGTLVPTTFYAKSDRTLRNGIALLLGALHGYGALVWTAGLAGLWILRRAMGWLLACVAAFGICFVAVGGDVLTERFSLFWAPLLWVGVCAGLDAVGRQVRQGLTPILVVLTMVVCGIELHRMYQVMRPNSGWEGYLYVSANSISTMETDAEIGRFLAEHANPGQTLVTDNIGAIGYYGGLRVMDFNGLTDTAIARCIKQGRRDLAMEHVKAARPDWIVGYPGPAATPEDYSMNTGSMGHWVKESYQPAVTLRSRTGYTRILLKRTDVILR